LLAKARSHHQGLELPISRSSVFEKVIRLLRNGPGFLSTLAERSRNSGELLRLAWEPGMRRESRGKFSLDVFPIRIHGSASAHGNAAVVFPDRSA
jgi:hypothetical protein